ncbi:MAG: Ig-like domain-containing protein [Chlorobiaceae bacterium]|nr:Ig-like domain-containing protein [Chlorobiaceae bacterium]
MKRFPGLKALAVLCIPLFFSACAVDRPPTGGLPDNSPLAVTASSPEPGTVNISPTTIRLEFNRFVTTAALTKAIFFSPSIRNYQVTMRGKEAEIRLYSPLKPGRTYTLTLKKSLKSYYGSELATSWSLPFSTGPSIDTGTLEGMVWTRLLAPASNVTVLAYGPGSSGTALPDSLPAAPDYLTQTDAAGNFRFESLARGNYRVLALRDVNNNLRFDRGKDEFGAPSVPHLATGTKGIAFRLAEGDTSAVAIKAVRPANAREIEVAFNRSLPSRLIGPESFTISEKSKGTPLPVLGCFTTDRAEWSSSFRVLTGPMNDKSSYSISLAGPLGLPRSKVPALTFMGGMHDVTWPGLSVAIVPPDKAINTIPELVRPGTGPCVELQFNLPVEEASVLKAVSLSASQNTGERQVPVTVSRYDSRTWTVRDVPGFEPGADYVLRVRPSLVVSPTGAKSMDSLVVSRFTTAGTDQYGEITVTGSTEAPELLIEARREGTSAAYRAIARPAATGGFSHTFRNLPPGNYTVFAFVAKPGQPLNPETRWEPGSIDPFRTSVPFAAVAANVRPAWTTASTLPDITARQQEPGAAPARPAINAKPVKKKNRH